MGNFSRDTFKLTNVMYQLTSGETVANPRHFTSVKLQQGVPVLDSDWNELDDIRKAELELVLAGAIGNGVPAGSDGFRIGDAGTDNDFTIEPGLIFVDGWVVHNSGKVAYSDQPFRNAEGVTPALPALQNAPSSEKDLVYLDAWEEEVDGEEDTDLVNDKIGVETCTRLMRVWVVRMKKIASDANPLDPATIPDRQPGHRYYALATVDRQTGGRIAAGMITDLRRLHLTLEDVTKAPLEIYGPLGELTYSLDNFANMLDITGNAYFDLLKSDLFMANNFATATPLETVTISAVFGSVMQTAKASSLQAQIRNLSNQDGLKVLELLYDAQKNLAVEIGKLVSGNADRITTSSLIDRLNELLDGNTNGTPPGLKKAVLTEKDLEAAIKAQENINLEIGNRTQILPHGHLSVRLVSGPPQDTVISVGQTYRYEFEISFEQVTPMTYQETFDLILAMDPTGWKPALVANSDKTVTLNTGEKVNVQVDINIPANATVNTATLQFRVRSQHNPLEMDTTNTEVSLMVGAGGTQPSPLNIELTSPAMNVATDTLLVGRGVPAGVLGKARNLTFKFSYLESAPSPVDFKVSFTSVPADVFDPMADTSFQLGAGAGQDTTKSFVLQATSGSANGTTGTLTVRIEKKTDSNVYKELGIKFQIQKS